MVVICNSKMQLITNQSFVAHSDHLFCEQLQSEDITVYLVYICILHFIINSELCVCLFKYAVKCPWNCIEFNCHLQSPWFNST